MSNELDYQKRVALIVNPETATVGWVRLDQTGQPPRVTGDVTGKRIQLMSLDDAPIAIYLLDDFAADYDRDAAAAISELVRVANGMPNVSVDVDEQMRQLRDQLKATTDNAQETFNKYEANIAWEKRRAEKIIESARGWKQRAQQRKIYVEHYQDQERTLRAEITDLEEKLRVSRNAVDRAVNRSNHSNDHVEEARARAHNAEINARQHASEASELRRQLGAAHAETHDLRERIVEVQANALDTINRVAAALPAPLIDVEIVEPDVEVQTWFGEDNVPVVQIDTEGGHGRLRINLNDGVVWDGDPETDERPGACAVPEEFSLETARAADGATISRQLDTIRDQAETIKELEARLASTLRDANDLREVGRIQRRGLDESENMRRQLDERLSSEKRVHETTTAALRAMLRGRNNLLSDTLDYVPTDTRLGQEIHDRAGSLPKLDTEADARTDTSVIQFITAVDDVLKKWKAAPPYQLTEQLNIALSTLDREANKKR